MPCRFFPSPDSPSVGDLWMDWDTEDALSGHRVFSLEGANEIFDIDLSNLCLQARSGQPGE